MSDTVKLVIQIENGNIINHPVTYSNFLLLFPECPIEETPTNEVVEQYGYNVFIRTPPPTPPRFISGNYIQKEDGTWTNTWVTTN
jgi:hypothetical protein